MNKEKFNKIVKDYEFACLIAERYKDYTLSSLCELFDILGYHCYNFVQEEMFDMEIGDLTLTYLFANKKIANNIQVWFETNENDGDWFNTDIENFKDLSLKFMAYKLYKETFYEEHDKDNTAVCFEEFVNNEWQDDEIREYYINKLKENGNV